MNKLLCPYCGATAKLESSIKIYGKDFGNVYICENYPTCDAYVGVHKRDNKPLGRLANAELREWKKQAHAAFDPLWIKKMSKGFKRKVARGLGYQWLAQQLNMTIAQCHIGMFDVEQCKQVVSICSNYLKRKN